MFTSTRDGNREVYVMDADGRHAARLTRNEVEDAWPRWSPDGRRIAYCSGLENRYEIYVMNADGSAPVRLTFLVHPR